MPNWLDDSSSKTPVEGDARFAEFQKRRDRDREYAGKDSIAPPETSPDTPAASPQEEESTRINTDEVMGKLTRAKDDEKRLKILEEAGVGIPEEGFQTWDDVSNELDRVATKQAKQEAVGPSATVGEAGAPASTGDDRVSLLAELERLNSTVIDHRDTQYHQKKQRLMNRKREILEKLK